MGGLRAPQFRRLCRYWHGSVRRLPVLRAQNVPVPAGPWPDRPVETSGPQNGAALCPQPCTPLPCHRRRASQGCGNARWSGRSYLLPSVSEKDTRSCPFSSQRIGECTECQNVPSRVLGLGAKSGARTRGAFLWTRSGDAEIDNGSDEYLNWIETSVAQ